MNVGPITGAMIGGVSPPRRRFSEILRELGRSNKPRILVSDLLLVFGDRAFGALMLVFAAPNMLPLPPGTSSVLGAPLVIVAAQLALGRRVLWLPQIVAERSIPMADFLRFADHLLKPMERIERVLKPRLSFLFGALGDRLIGIVCLMLGVVLFLPIPLGNMLPAMAVTAFGVALVERDGLAAMIGWILAALSLAVVAAVFGALLVAARAFIGALTGI